MKKIFTLIALLGVSLMGWADSFDPSVNIAEGKNAVSGWPMTGNEVPGKAVDNNLSTHWISWQSSADKAWWGIDLEAEYRLRSFTIVWENSGRSSSHFLIQVATGDVAPEDFVDNASYSSDGWTTIAEINETQSGEESGNSYDLDIVTGRYVRFVSLQNVAQTSIKEFRLYADELASKPEVTPVMGGAGVSSDLSEASATLTLTATDHNGDALHSFLLKDQAGKVFRVTTDGSDQATLTGLANKRYAFSVWAIEEGCLSASSSSVVIGENTFDPSTNLALNKPAYAVRYQGNTTNTPDKANDGSLTNFWNAGSDSGEGIAAADQDKVWWYVDLQDQYELKSLALFWEGAYANSFIMQVRKDAPTLAQAGDDSEWETFLDYSGSQSAGTSEGDINLYGDITDSKSAFSITPKGRYVRFRAKAAQNWGWGVKLREVRIYGSGYLALDNTAPIISEASYYGMTADYLGVKFNVAATDDQTDPVTEFVVVDQNSVAHNVTVDEGIITVTDMPTGKNVNVTIYALDAAGNRSLGEVVNISYLRPEENIALDKDAYACVNIGAGEGPAKAVDGSTTSDWTSWNYAHHDNAWWYVDLGDFYDIRRIEVVWTTDRHSTDFSIQYRQNAPEVDGATESEWHNFPNCTGLSGDQEITVTNTQARYICMRSKVNYSNNQVRLAEFRVFGKAFATPDNDAPLISSASYNGTTVDYTGLKFNITVSDNVTAVEDLVFKVEDPEGVEHEATYDEGVITVTGMPTFKNEDITLYAIDAVPNKSTGYIVENVSYVDPTENLAYHKDAYACVHINDGEGKLMPVDGNTSTTWTSYSHANHANDWWYVDLGDFYDIRRIEVVWQENRHSTDFSIQYRQNPPAGDSGATEDEWETKYSNLSGDQELDAITGMQARYICMRSKDYYHDQEHAQVRMSEFRVYGKSFATVDANPPVITTAYVHYNDDGKAYLHLEATDLEDGAVNRFRVTNTNTSTTEVMTTNGDDEIVIDGLTIGTLYTFEVEAMDNVDNLSDVTELKVNVPAPTSTNIAPLGTASAGYEHQDSEAAGKANDGNANTLWTNFGSSEDANEWWAVKLDGVYHLTKIAVLWKDDNYASKYTIKVRMSDTDEWETLTQITNTTAELEGKTGTDRVVETLVDKVAGQVRIDIDEDYVGGFTRVYEVMVYADAKMINFEDNGSNSGLIEEYNDHEVLAVINRDILADNTWYTLCLPFDMDADKVSEVFGASTIATLVGSEDRGSLIHLNFDYVSAIQAGKPYLIKPGQTFTAGTTISGVTIKNVDPSAAGYKAEAEHMYFQGTFNKIMLQGEDKRYVSENNELYAPNPDGGSAVGAFRCYFTIPDGSPALAPGKRAVIVFGPQQSTGIDQVVNGKCENAKIMLDGVLYIIRDGKTYNAQGMLIK